MNPPGLYTAHAVTAEHSGDYEAAARLYRLAAAASETERYRERWLREAERCEIAGREPAAPPPARGVGTELHKLLTELGITPDASCQCEAMRQQMDRWGPAGCREHFAEIVAHVRTAYSKTDWATVLKAGVLAARQGLPLTIEGLVELAIERSERASR